MNFITQNPVYQSIAAKVRPLWQPVERALVALQSPALLVARLYVAWAFFSAGLTKIQDWGTTVALFTDEYKVPLLSPNVAAFMGTAGELVLPVLLALGLFGRFAALGLLVVNYVAVISLSEIAPAALMQHHLWGALLLMVALFGSGRWGVCAWCENRGVAK